MVTEIVILGAGGFAREVAWLAEACSQVRPVAFVDEDPGRVGQVLNDLPVLSLEEAKSRFPQVGFVPAVGSPDARRDFCARAEARGLRPVTLVHPRAEISRFVSIGTGSVVCAGSTLTTNIEVGRFVQINLHCTVGHDVVIEDFATLAPGVHVSGNVRISSGAYLGSGAVVINGRPGAPLVIGRGAVVGAAACVTGHVEPGVTVVGVPARSRARS